MRVNDASIKIQARQVPGADSFGAIYEGSTLKLKMAPFQVTTWCKGASDTPAAAHSGRPGHAPSKVGYMQIAILETNWAYYRGLTAAEGSMIEDFSHGKGTPLRRDFDSSSDSPWYVGTPVPIDSFGLPVPGTQGPWDFEPIFGDKPGNQFEATRTNPKTKAPNHLYEAKVAVAFLTSLTEESSPGVFRHLRHFQWSACWHFRHANEQAAHDRKTMKRLGATAFWKSEFKVGEPSDARYVDLLNSTSRALAWETVVQNRGRAPLQVAHFDYKPFDLMTADGELF